MNTKKQQANACCYNNVPLPLILGSHQAFTSREPLPASFSPGILLSWSPSLSTGPAALLVADEVGLVSWPPVLTNNGLLDEETLEMLLIGFVFQ
jgi:hypothetical protein